MEDDPSVLELSEYLPLILRPQSEKKKEGKRSLLIGEAARGKLLTFVDESLFLKYYFLLYSIFNVKKLAPIDRQIPVFNVMVSKEQ